MSANFIARKDIDGLLAHLELNEMASHSESNQKTLTLDHVEHLLALLIANDLNEARYLIKRTTQRDDIFNALIALTNALWQWNFKQTWAIMTSMSSDNSVFSGYFSWLKEVILERAVTLIANSYDSINVETCQVILGLSGDQFESYIASLGWEINEMYIIPKPLVTVKSGKREIKHFNRLADYIVQLEV